MNPATPPELPRERRIEIAHIAIQNEVERIKATTAEINLAQPERYETLAWQIECATAQIRAWRAHLRELEGTK